MSSSNEPLPSRSFATLEDDSEGRDDVKDLGRNMKYKLLVVTRYYRVLHKLPAFAPAFFSFTGKFPDFAARIFSVVEWIDPQAYMGSNHGQKSNSPISTFVIFVPFRQIGV